MARFTQRSKRLSRQRESAIFQSVLMPLGMLVGFIGLLILGLVLFDHLIKQGWEAEAFVMAVSACLLPVVLFLFRWTRGHFNRQLEHS